MAGMIALVVAVFGVGFAFLAFLIGLLTKVILRLSDHKTQKSVTLAHLSQFFWPTA